MKDEEFFIHTMDDLRCRMAHAINAKSVITAEYSIIKASGILRLLVLDPCRLHEVLAKKYDMTVKFDVNGDGGPSLPIKDPMFYYSSIDANDIKSAYAESVHTDKLLQLKPLFFNSQNYSVREIIHTLSNVNGGVHLGVNKKPFHHRFNEDANKYMGMIVKAMIDIIWVFVVGVMELEHKVREESGIPF